MLYCTKLRNFILFDFLQKLCKICFIYYDNLECGLLVLGKMSTEIYKKYLSYNFVKIVGRK